MSSKKQPKGDERFTKITKDPRFWETPDVEKKVRIDKRFQSMFHDERFKLKYTVDKRGRPVSHTSTEDLKRFYQLSDSEHTDGEEEEEEEEEMKKKKKKGKQSLEKEEEESVPEKTVKIKTLKPGTPAAAELVRGVRVIEEGEEDEEEEEDEGLSADDDGSEDDDDDEDDSEDEGDSSESDSGPDLARGKGNVETSDEDEEEENEVDEYLRREEEEIEHNWGEMWKDAPRTEEMSRRLAVCNMDWDRIKAKDLLALFSSFKPKGGVVLSVTIYPSDFGKERMKAEETQGPLELTNLPDDPEADTEDQRIYREKVRDYQFKRLRYYYAVVECDSVETATKIYEECDGLEYESSCSMVDLRFIPDDVTFDDEPRDRATDVDLTVYQPKFFTSATTTTTKVELTWDETDHDRVTALSKKFNKGELLDMDFNAYLASSSEEEEEEQPEEEAAEAEEQPEELKEEKKEGKRGKKKKKKKEEEEEDQIAKYRELLQGIQDKDKKKDQDMEMEITWVPGLKATTEKLVKKKLEGKDKLTPWEEFLEKKKEKKKEKRKEKKEEEVAISDDELPAGVDLDDPFFAEELNGMSQKTKKTKKNKKEEEQRTPEEEAELEKQKAEMALLMDDDEEKHQHFNYDKIVEQQNLSKKRRKKLMKSNTLLEEDKFQVDVQDPRFQAVFTSHLYNLDPSDPAYKKTKGTQSILEEKQKRREQQEHGQKGALKSQNTLENPSKSAVQRENTTSTTTSTTSTTTPTGGDQTSSQRKEMDPSLSSLIKSVKNKTEQFQARKKQRIK